VELGADGADGGNPVRKLPDEQLDRPFLQRVHVALGIGRDARRNLWKSG
jgi:hypothetical protein